MQKRQSLDHGLYMVSNHARNLVKGKIRQTRVRASMSATKAGKDAIVMHDDAESNTIFATMRTVSVSAKIVVGAMRDDIGATWAAVTSLWTSASSIWASEASVWDAAALKKAEQPLCRLLSKPKIPDSAALQDF